jgi:uncharacterized protein (DUF2235 family)
MALYAFDGTWNEDKEGTGNDTNVVKFREAYLGTTFYLEGVGERGGLLGKFLGGLFGLGGRRRLTEAMDALEANFKKGDRVIDIVGFSRGAALARHFANDVMEEINGAEIRFLGVWDTVASFGIPGNKINLGWTLTLPGNVKKCYHAMALDERRRGFPLTRVAAGNGAPPSNGRLREVWFRGVHSDVGGGQNIEISSISLCWMLRRAIKNKLPIDSIYLAKQEDLCHSDAPISDNLDLKPDPFRKIAANDWVHPSVKTRGTIKGVEHNDPPSNLMCSAD